jgi:hypothetical protein
MSKIHYFQRYSSVENTVTNNTLQLLARIYNYSPSQASKLLTDITGEPIEIGIEINQQNRAEESIPDGAVLQRSFKILIESKVDSKTDVDQLVRHATNFTNEVQKILLLLTKENVGQEKEKTIFKKIARKYEGVIFKNITYEGVCNAITGLFKDYEYEMQELIGDYIEYCNEANLFDQSKYLMRVVPCGESIVLNKRYSIYFQPSDRGYTPHSYVGIYSNKKVRDLLEIDSVFDIGFKGKKLKKTLVQGRDTNDYNKNIIAIIRDAKTDCGYQIGNGHRFFCAKETFKTDYVKNSPGGIMGARRVNLKKVIGKFSDAKDVAEKLKGKVWE